MRCWVHDRTHGDGWRDTVTPAVAIYVAQPSGNRVPLCTPCLNMWLDNCDDDPGSEPSDLQWLS